MELRSLIVCEYASIRPEGIFTVVGGGMRQLATTKLPLVFSVSLLIMLECSFDEGNFDLHVQLRDADGKKLFNLKQPFRVGSKTKVHTAVIRLERLKITQSGDYSFEVFVGQRSLGSYPLTVICKEPRPTVGS